MKFLTTLAVLPLALAACSKNDSTGNVDQPAAAPVAAAAAPAGQNWTETVVKTPEGSTPASRTRPVVKGESVRTASELRMATSAARSASGATTARARDP